MEQLEDFDCILSAHELWSFIPATRRILAYIIVVLLDRRLREVATTPICKMQFDELG